MIYNSKILLIGGATRNVGKTMLSTKIISHFSEKQHIVGVKIKTIYPNDSFFHGKDIAPLGKGEKYRITQELSSESLEDTNKMLLGGAKLVFKLKVEAEFMKIAYKNLAQRIPENYFWVVESNSLRGVIKPAIFLLIKHENSGEIKPSAQKLQHLADRIIFTDGKKHDFDVLKLNIEEDGWKLLI